MTLRVLHYSDIENAYDDPERVGQLAGTIEARRDDRTVVVGTGDNTAPGVLALQTEGRQALDLFRAIEPDLETFGNHDFDFGPGPLRDLVADAPQRWVCANAHEADGEGRFAGADPTAVIERGGARVGFVGVIDPDTPAISGVETSLATTDPVTAVREHLPRLRERADHVVVLAHLRAESERAIARLDGVDALLGGHVHEERCDRIDGTLCLRPGANGRVVWEVELGKRATATRHAVADGRIDESVAAALRDRMAETGLTEVVGTVAEPIVRERRRRYGGECRIANLVTDAYRWATGADAGFVQTGGVRDGPPLSGEVTAADLVGVSPFGGSVRVVALSGDELRELVAHSFAPEEIERSHWRQWFGHFSGLRVRYHREEEEIREVRIGGDRPDPDAEYALATNAYAVETEFGPLSPDRVVHEWGRPQYEAIVEYVRKEGLDVELDGRLSAVDG